MVAVGQILQLNGNDSRLYWLVLENDNKQGKVLVCALSTASDDTDIWSMALKPEDVEDVSFKSEFHISFATTRLFNIADLKFTVKGMLVSSTLAEVLRQRCLQGTRAFYNTVHKKKVDMPFSPGDRIGYGGRVYDQEELCNAVSSSLDFWLTYGPYSEELEKRLAAFVGVKNCSLVNSGSSANLLAFAALTSSKLGDKRIMPGDEVITVSCAFPTTVAPIIQFGARPVFVDVGIPSYNMDVAQLEVAYSSRTKAVFLAHTLGNPFDVAAVRDFCSQHDVWLIEDNCDALGSQYQVEGSWRNTGSFGAVSTVSFYASHHMTTGEGGAVFTDSDELMRIIESFRDWGRDCRCKSGMDNVCNNRFNFTLGELPYGYDHKYIYSELGFNLRPTDLQAAIGCAQLDKLPAFIESRRKNWESLRKQLNHHEDVFHLPEPTLHSKPSWFGFLLTLRDVCSFERTNLVKFLESRNIQTRMLFSGNLLKHPCFDSLRKDNTSYRIVGDLSYTDKIMRDTFWIGVYPGLDEHRISYMADSIDEFVATQVRAAQ